MKVTVLYCAMSWNKRVCLGDTPSPVYKPSLKHNIQGLPLELQEKIYKDVWQGLAQDKSQWVTEELLCREIHKRKVTIINQRVRFLWIKGAFYYHSQLSLFTRKDFFMLLERYPDWQWDEIRHYIHYMWRKFDSV